MAPPAFLERFEELYHMVMQPLSGKLTKAVRAQITARVAAASLRKQGQSIQPV